MILWHDLLELQFFLLFINLEEYILSEKIKQKIIKLHTIKNMFLIKILASYFVDINKLTLDFMQDFRVSK